MSAINYKTISSLKLQQRDGWFLLRHYGHSFRCLPFIKCHPDELISRVFQCLHLSVTHRSFTFEFKEKQEKGNAYNSLDSFWLDFASGRRRASHTHRTATAHWRAKYHVIAASCTGLFEMSVGVLTTCHTQYTWDRIIRIFLFNRTTLQVFVTYHIGALYVHPLWFYKHQHVNRVCSKLFVACQRWWFEW